MQLTEPRQSNSEAPGSSPVAVAVRANRYDLLSRLADDLAHEIKNPLNAIVVNLEVMRRRVESGAADRALERADVIEHEVRRVHTLVDQLLQLLRQAKSDTALVAVDTVIESIATAVATRARAARVTFEWEMESGLYSQIQSESLKFALLNLVTRAIDAEAEAGGTVTLKARSAADEIYIVVQCSRAVLGPEDEYIRFCRLLTEGAGGALESLEPHNGGTGSTVTLVVPSGRLG